MRTSLAPVDCELTPGTELNGQWVIGVEITRTRTSTIYRCEHARTGIIAAVKLMMPRAGILDDVAEARFRREAMVTARLTTPDVLRVFDFGTTSSGVPFLVMELLEGITLRDLLAMRAKDGARGISPAATIRIVDAVLRALSEAHSIGLIHRSVKPANIFLAQLIGGEIAVKLIDFGVAHDVSQPLTQMGDKVGTPTHMSPEQAYGREIDGRSDLYSIGVVMYECLTGELPFKQVNPLALAVAHTTLEPAPIHEVSQQSVPLEVSAVVHKALAKQPGDRWDDARSMRDALHAVSAVLDASELLRALSATVIAQLKSQQSLATVQGREERAVAAGAATPSAAQRELAAGRSEAPDGTARSLEAESAGEKVRARRRGKQVQTSGGRAAADRGGAVATPRPSNQAPTTSLEAGSERPPPLPVNRSQNSSAKSGATLPKRLHRGPEKAKPALRRPKKALSEQTTVRDGRVRKSPGKPGA